MKKTFNVKVTSEGRRIDLFLCSQLKNFSRSMIQRQIKSGNIQVDKIENLKSSYSLKRGDVIKVDLKDDAKRLDVKPYKMLLDIIYQNSDLVVVNKKSGLCVHPTSSNSTKTLINGLLYKFKVLKDVGSGVKLGLIHRIDKDTSGIILIALNNKSLWYYSRQFERRMVEKYYLAVVNGDVRKLFGRGRRRLISNYIGRNPKNRKKMAIVDKKKGRLASTYIYFLDFVNDPNLGPISLVLAKPLTGRTHQIRVHLSDLGYPILGDKIYGRTEFKRMMLHAHFLRIKLLSGHTKSFHADIPAIFYKLFGKDKIILPPK